MSASPRSIATSARRRISASSSIASAPRSTATIELMPVSRDLPVNDLQHMKAALTLARRGLGSAWPNPTVGCVLVKDGRVVGRGWTQPGGRPHGETEALARAGAAARGATAYVSLEPCCHWGKTPPCTDALIAAGLARVVIPIEDPDPRVSGQGIARLRGAGIVVETGLCAEEAAELNAGFLLRMREGRPLVTLKLATTLDGRIATHSGESRWITGPLARDRAHALRDGDQLRQETFRSCGVELIEVHADGDAGIDIGEGLRALGERGLTRILVEGGAHLAASLLRERRVDRLAWFRAPRMIGGDGIPAVVAFGLERLGEAPGFERSGLMELGEDVLETYRRAP